MTFSFKVSDLYLIKKETLATALLYTGMLIAFLGSLYPWFLWPIATIYPAFASMFIMGAWMISRTMSNPLFTRKDYLYPIIALILFLVYERLSLNSNINGFIIMLFKMFNFSVFLCLKIEKLQEMLTFICKVMGVLLGMSLFGHFLYLGGFPLPGGNDVQFGEWYSFTNYYLFLLDDRNLFTFVPRFNSYFLEPGHIGTCIAFLLFSQRGQWKKWYNMILLATLFFTFSLAAYIYLVVIIFLNLWIGGKKMLQKLLITLLIIGAGVVATFTYNNGDNLVYNLIMLRLEVEDGEMAGDNRVTGNFEADYDNYITSSDIFFGREMDDSEFGNAGFRVFFYEHGIIGLILIGALYIISMMYTENKRALWGVMFIASLYFAVTAFMLWECIFFSLYATAYSPKLLMKS